MNPSALGFWDSAQDAGCERELFLSFMAKTGLEEVEGDISPLEYADILRQLLIGHQRRQGPDDSALQI